MGLFSFTQEIAIDLGTANTIIICNDKVVVDEPSVVAISMADNKMVAVGRKAQQMIGKGGTLIRTVRPLRDGVIADFYACEMMIRGMIKMIPKQSKIGWGGTQTFKETGMLEALSNGEYELIDRMKAKTPEESREIFAQTILSDYFFMSANAITEDGVLVNIDGNSNRVSAYAYGPRKLVLIVGMNKVTADVDSAMKRARNEAAPINAQRFNLSTPCAKTGSCMDCKSPDTICCQFLITRFSKHKDRIHVILVNENLGF